MVHSTLTVTHRVGGVEEEGVGEGPAGIHAAVMPLYYIPTCLNTKTCFQVVSHTHTDSSTPGMHTHSHLVGTIQTHTTLFARTVI